MNCVPPFPDSKPALRWHLVFDYEIGTKAEGESYDRGKKRQRQRISNIPDAAQPDGQTLRFDLRGRGRLFVEFHAFHVAHRQLISSQKLPQRSTPHQAAALHIQASVQDTFSRGHLPDRTRETGKTEFSPPGSRAGGIFETQFRKDRVAEEIPGPRDRSSLRSR